MSKNLILFFFCLLMNLILFGQHDRNSFKSLSGPEKWWVISHPFQAKNALKTSIRALNITDSLKELNSIGRDLNGGHLDAFKHAFWMASLSHKIGSRSAIKLGKAHEKGNYKSFLKGNPEDGVLPDKISSDMDLFNNQAGALVATNHPKVSELELIDLILELMKKGGLRIIKKDKGIFLTCTGVPIESSLLVGSWENNKCLVPSNDP